MYYYYSHYHYVCFAVVCVYCFTVTVAHESLCF